MCILSGCIIVHRVCCHEERKKSWSKQKKVTRQGGKLFCLVNFLHNTARVSSVWQRHFLCRSVPFRNLTLGLFRGVFTWGFQIHKEHYQQGVSATKTFYESYNQKEHLKLQTSTVLWNLWNVLISWRFQVWLFLIIDGYCQHSIN